MIDALERAPFAPYVPPQASARLVLFAECESTLRRAADAAGAERPVSCTREWRAFEAAAQGAACAVAVIPWLGRCDLAGRLADLTARPLRVPVVLVTTKDADNARHLHALAADEVVWLHELDAALAGAVRRARARGTLERLAHALARADRLPPKLRDALAHACCSERPVHSVEALAAAVGCHRRTLWYHWHRALDADVTLRLEDFLGWLLLLRAVGRKGRHVGWPAVADALGVHEHTLARTAKLLTGLALRDLASADPRSFAEQFVERVVAPLLGDAPCHILG